MGIFTKRDVLRGEEITFNYNVDRYGCAKRESLDRAESRMADPL
jgi:SET domain-containing protein